MTCLTKYSRTNTSSVLDILCYCVTESKIQLACQLFLCYCVTGSKMCLLMCVSMLKELRYSQCVRYFGIMCYNEQCVRFRYICVVQEVC